ncbi:MAG: SIS domain-containing protein [Candidatus Lokiarchaeota archaeon]|nr:SIS domain-containing protein [Candidatus Lokiarchaeota archaeon]
MKNKSENQFKREIFTQPKVLLECLEKYEEEKYRIIDETYDKFYQIHNQKVSKPIRKIVFIGIGTSYYAALIAYQYLNENTIKNRTQIDCEVQDAGELLYFQTFNQNDDDILLIFVSQSGESGEIIEILNKLEKNRFPYKNIWCITNTKGSTLDKTAFHTMYMFAGEEQSVTNKTYLCSLLVIYILALTIERSVTFTLSDITINNLMIDLQEEIKQIADAIQDIMDNWATLKVMLGNFLTLNSQKSSKGSTEKAVPPAFINYISRGTGLATTGQAALNTKEVAKVYSESISISMFRHGCIEIINQDYRAVIISNSPEDRNSVSKLIMNISRKWIGSNPGRVILITNSENQALSFEKDPNVLVFLHGIKNRFLCPIYEIVPIQAIFFTLAELRGNVPGVFKFSSKITK